LHFTHDETVNGEDPEGSEGSRGEDKYEPCERTRALLGKEEELDV
jgi:hypothetical protein